MSGHKGAVPALLLTKTTLVCHVLLHSRSPFLVPTLVSALHHQIRAAIVGREVVLYIDELHLATTIGAVHEQTQHIPMSISVSEGSKRWIGLLCSPAGSARVGYGLPPLNALCAVDVPTAIGLHRVVG